MGIKTIVEHEYPRWPNYLRQRLITRPREAGACFEAPMLDVGELTGDQVSELARNFVEHCARRAVQVAERRRRDDR